ncbi:aminoglycoside phosphotransferase family protein [Pseudotabrizicola sp.]|uniref:aminoglycoside phosphotransferase family protein n=1 Tax=Pseudotabrizicola sp. TaxID=2939647 RepID=UPI00272245E2|nr:phosphotransferase [Pseudotabrizicola sp.]MDO8882764.1 phosphotransferase [Pseudotabrizicola sp.]
MADRKTASTSFLSAQGWGNARRHFLAGDASDRRYDRVVLSGKTAILMDAPPGTGDDPADFVSVAHHLHGIGLSAPKILAKDLTQGFLLIEDLGDALFARVLDHAPQREAALYQAAAAVLAHLHRHSPPPGLPDLSAQDWASAAAFALDWYAFGATGERPDRAAFVAALADALHNHADGPRVMILRDYHAENLLDLPDRDGVAAVGLLDFQLAQMGQPGYDLVSLLQDARRDVSADVATLTMARFADATGRDRHTFEASCAVLGAQRALRILGIFTRLCMVGGKPGYLRLMPRVWGQLHHNLAHPALSDLRQICATLLPAPTDTILQKIGDQCATHSP